MRFVPTDYTERHVIHCPSKEAWDKVVEVLNSYGLKTASGRSFKSWHSSFHDCIRFMAGVYGSFSNYKSEPYNYTILEYDDFEWEEAEEDLDVKFGIDELFK